MAKKRPERRQQSRRSRTIGGRRKGDVTSTLHGLLALVGDIATRVPVHSQTTQLHASVAALLRADQPHAVRLELERLARLVDRALAQDPLLQLEATIVRLRLALGDD